MTSQLFRPATVTAPVPAPVRGTLLDAATIIEGIELIDTEGMFNSYNCLATDSVAVFPCPTPDPVPDPKTFNSPAYQDGLRFAVYSGLVCKAPGFDRAEGFSNLQRVFDEKESVAVARNLLTTRFVASAGNWAVPTNITPAGGAVDPTVGLALLEGHAGSNYAGIPTVHMGRTIASILIGRGAALEFVGNELFSKLGSKIAADSGYESPNSSPTGTANAAGEQWIYASGEVLIARSNPVFQEWDIDRSTNEVKILRERMYVAAVDCYTAAIKVKVQ